MKPQPTDGERISGEGGLGVTLLADVEQIGLVSVRSEPGNVTPPLHLHRQHAECFFVLDGELGFRLEDREVRATAGQWVYVPPDVVHSFSVLGDTPAHVLDVHVPSCGLGNFVRGLQAARNERELQDVRAAFDQQPAPEYATGDPGLVTLRRGGGAEGETMSGRSERRRATLLLDTDEITVTFDPTKCRHTGVRGAEPHIHHHHADGFLVLKGELTIGFLSTQLRAPAGTLVVIPPRVVHSFDNDGAENALFYNLHMPSSGFGDYLRGRNPDFDQHEPPADGGADPASAIATRLPR